MSHFTEVCQYGKAHAQCRCPGPKAVRTVECSTPALHDPEYQPQSEEPTHE